MKNLKGSATWKNVDTISFGNELLVQYTRAEWLQQQPVPKRNDVHLLSSCKAFQVLDRVVSLAQA